MDVNGPIQILELFADGTFQLSARNKPGRGHVWKIVNLPYGCTLEQACRRFVELDPDYVPEHIREHASWWGRMMRLMGRNK